MNDLTIIEEAPLFEPINTMTDKRRENRKAISSRLRKGLCAKNPWTRKQALTAAAFHAQRQGRQIWTYRCPRCSYFHLTHKRPRR